MRLSAIALFAFTFILAGCIHYKEYPFSYTNNIKLDTQLIGTWKLDTNKTKEYETTTIIFKRNSTQNMYNFYMKEEGETSPIISAYPTSIEEYHYINIQDEGNITKYNFMKYKVSKNQLILWIINENTIAKAITNKTILGDVSSNMPVLPSTDIYFWENAINIRRYLLNNDKKLFDKPIYFIRDISTQSPTSSK